MWTRLIVTSLFVVGVSGLVAPMFFSGARRITDPLSPKIVGHGVAGVHGVGLVTLVITSEISVFVAAPGVGPPRTPVSESITRYTGELPWRDTSPQETAAAASAASASACVM